MEHKFGGLKNCSILLYNFAEIFAFFLCLRWLSIRGSSFLWGRVLFWEGCFWPSLNMTLPDWWLFFKTPYMVISVIFSCSIYTESAETSFSKSTPTPYLVSCISNILSRTSLYPDTQRQATQHDRRLPGWSTMGTNKVNKIAVRKIIFCTGWLMQPRHTKILLYWHDEPNEPSKEEGPLLFILFEPPIISVSTVWTTSIWSFYSYLLSNRYLYLVSFFLCLVSHITILIRLRTNLSNVQFMFIRFAKDNENVFILFWNGVTREPTVERDGPC